MTRVLCVAEKPSIAKSISQILSNGQGITSRAGRDKYCRNYSFPYRLLAPWGDVEMTVTSVRGHLNEHDFGEGFRKWGDCDPVALFDAPIHEKLTKEVKPYTCNKASEVFTCVRRGKKPRWQRFCSRLYLTRVTKPLPAFSFGSRSNLEDGKDISANLVTEARHCQLLIIWTDCDREGEHIGAEIVKECRKGRRNIEVKRARFSAIIANQIHRACQNPVELDWRSVSAVESRMEMDLRLGAAFTRMQTLGLKRVNELEDKLISYGPCQFPTLGFVVDQYERVRNFVAERFWFIAVSHQRNLPAAGGAGNAIAIDLEDEGGGDGQKISVDFKWRRNHLFDFNTALVLFEGCVESPEAEVTNVNSRPTKKWKPYPLTTVELQKSGSRLLRLTPKRVLDIAEGLYNKGLLSYPRTETDQYDKDFDFRSLIAKQTNDDAWGAYATNLMNDGESYERPRNGRKNDAAHPPIHPAAHANDLNGDDKRVYEYVTRRFLGSCSRDATGNTVTVELDIAGEMFTATGLTIAQRNYLEVFTYDKWNGNLLPHFTRGEKFIPSSCNLKEGRTSRPKLLTEADLVGLMDKNGIGTDATIAEHIQKIIDREYIMAQMQGRTKYLVPSTLGIGLVEGYNQIETEKSLTRPLLRRETEFRMNLICSGERTKQETLHESLNEYQEVYARTKNNLNILVESVTRYLRGEAGGEEMMQGSDEEQDEGQAGHDDDDDDDFGGRGGGNRGGGRGNQARGRGRGGRGAAAPRGARGGRGGAAAARRSPARRQDSYEPDDDDDRGPRPGGGGARAAANGRAAVRPARNNSNQNIDGPPDCPCGEQAVERTVSKEGPNLGKVFYACSKPREDAANCKFFEWADENQSRGGGGGPSNSRAPANRGGDPGEAPQCGCNETAVERTVAKDGPNKGKKFWCCGKPQGDGQCRFFAWQDESAGGGGGGGGNRVIPAKRSAPSGSASRNQRSYNNHQNDDDLEEESPRCTCGLEASIKTVTKDGENQGRRFYCCPKESQRVRCKFFEWEDGSDESGNLVYGNRSAAASTSAASRNNYVSGAGSAYGSTSNNQGSGSGSGSGGGATGTCFNCGQEGHWSSNCPTPKRAGGSSNNYGSGSGGTSGTCFNCQQEGHWSSSCPDKAGSSGSRGRGRGRGRGHRR